MFSVQPPRRARTDYDFCSATNSKNAPKDASEPTLERITVKAVSVPVAQVPPAQRHVPVHRVIAQGPPTPSSPSSPLTSPPPQPRKRKSKSMPKGGLGDESDLPRDVKRLRTTSAPKKTTSRGSSRSENLAPSPEPIYRIGSRSRSTSSFPPLASEAPTFKRDWRTDEDGTPGERHLTSKSVVELLMKTYKAYFKNPQDPNDDSFEPHAINPPVVELEYPNRGASEQYILLAPKDVDHYNPIYDLESSLYTIVEYYCTEEQKALFGPIPMDTLSESTSRSSTPEPEPALPPVSSSPSKPNSEATFKRALDDEDGPAFVRILKEINQLLRSFKEVGPEKTNTLMEAPLKWRDAGFPNKVMMRIVEENYQRTVGPNVPKLRGYKAFSSTVYGELMPSLVDEIVRVTNMNEDSLFLDLGSGASLQTGCRSFGVELMPAPASVAVNGLRIGDMELEEGDMLKSRRLDELMAKADVVLVDNKVFTVKLNESLRPKFLDLKEGAIVVSLAPFVSSLNARMIERNLDDISTIFDVTEREYHSGSVSWGNGRGSYYIHKVDRMGYAEIRAKYESAHPRRVSRSREGDS
ncbi:histone-lysine N-methyltransferase [Ephemerocybe angulata]|uniref:Histone-lysine N-methyltransferase, H3 lysine-79 specific n=1 Tax=Ephemerocybe angulata TaxID=980116 RepID=A0A8H6IHW6_9AGAR|nr:histone-lysine N-methyltransferase [Tulosesus angulatus]